MVYHQINYLACKKNVSLHNNLTYNLHNTYTLNYQYLQFEHNLYILSHFGHFGHPRGQKCITEPGILTASTVLSNLFIRATTYQTGFQPSGIRPLSTASETVVYTIVSRVQNYGEPGYTLRGAQPG
ncbi:hypothetical protein ACI65C_007224 [Semiaphis heraclei]